MRTGYTTGANACAAACAALELLLSGELAPWTDALPELTADRYEQVAGSVLIHIPNGEAVRFAVKVAERCGDSAQCSVIKDGGDDPDCTHRAEIWARVRLIHGGEIELFAGDGVGTVTRPGLGLKVGGPAINPVPQQNMRAELRARLPQGVGVRVTIGVVDGAQLAKKTLNARLGILGGVSILGTTGVVRPYSTAAFRASVTQAIDVASSQGVCEVVLTTGGRSERFAQALLPHLDELSFVQMGDFVGHSLNHAAKRGVARVSICAMMGKLSKMADGQTMTHAKGSKVNMALLSGLADGVGVPKAVCEQILSANTGRHVSELVTATGLQSAFFTAICERVQLVLMEHLGARWPNPPELRVLFVDFGGALLGQAPQNALELPHV